MTNLEKLVAEARNREWGMQNIGTAACFLIHSYEKDCPLFDKCKLGPTSRGEELGEWALQEAEAAR